MRASMHLSRTESFPDPRLMNPDGSFYLEALASDVTRDTLLPGLCPDADDPPGEDRSRRLSAEPGER